MKDFEFKEVTNLTTNKKTYFINNKRVDFGKFCSEQLFCDIEGLRYNTSYIYTNKNKRYSICHYSG
jgi:hypothetical protein